MRFTKKKHTVEECPDCQWYNPELNLCAFNYDGESHPTFEEFAEEFYGDVELVDDCWCFKIKEWTNVRETSVDTVEV
jgi:hypothetical protein